MYQGQSLFGAPFSGVAPDGSRVYSAGGTYVKVAPDGSVWNSTNGTTWNQTNTLIDDGGNTSLNPTQGGASDIVGGLANTVQQHMPAETLGDTLTTLAKASPAVIAPAILAGANPAIADIFGVGTDAGSNMSAFGDIADLGGESSMFPGAELGGDASMLPGAELGGDAADATSTGLSTGSKLSGLLKGIQNFGGSGTPGTSAPGVGTTPRGNAAAGAAAQLAMNRAAAAKIDQGGPAADKTAMQNLFRSSIVSKMDPNAAPISINGNALPTLANSDLVSQAGAYNKSLAARLAAGKTPTDFGIADPTQQETTLNNQALNYAGLNGGVNGTLGDINDYIQTGKNLASFGSGAYGLGKSIYNIWQ